MKHLRPPPSPRRIRFNCLLIGVLVFLWIGNIYLLRPQFLADVEGRMLDERFRMRGPVEPSGQVAIVAVDDASIEALGRWPWPRTDLARLVNAINAAGAATIGLDIIFSESESTQILSQLMQLPAVDPDTTEKLQEIIQSNPPDQLFAETIRDAGNVVNGLFFYMSPQDIEDLAQLPGEVERSLLENAAVTAVRSRTSNLHAPMAEGVKLNIPEIARATDGAGFYNFAPGSDGIIRAVPMVIQYRDDVYSSFAVMCLASHLGNLPVVVFAEHYGITHLAIGDKPVTTNERGEIIVNYLGPQGTIPTYSALDVLQGKLPATALQDKLVLLGVTSTGLFDSHSTPVGPSVPGVEIQANIVENLMSGNSLQQTNLESLLDLVTIALIVLLLSTVLPRLKHFLTRTLFSVTLIAVYIIGNYLLFISENMWIVLTYPLMAWLLTFLAITLYLSMAVARSYASVRSTFAPFLHPGVVEKLTRNPRLLEFGGDEQFLTVLFSDIRGFTATSELLSPHDVSRFLRCYMDPMTDCVQLHNGTLDKYIGDAIMAIYGAPYPSSSHARDACDSALDMLESLDSIQTCCPDLKDVFPVKIGIGIHTGNMIVGNLGSSRRFNYTVIGDNVNLASRLEGLCKQYGVSIIISETTRKIIGTDYVCRELDTVRVIGRKASIRVYELRGKTVTSQDAFFLQQWDRGIKAYKQRDWEGGIGVFSTITVPDQSDLSCELYLKRCREYQRSPPPPEWDGVAELHEK